MLWVANLLLKAMHMSWTLWRGGLGAARCSDSSRRNFSVVRALWARTAFFCLLKPAQPLSEARKDTILPFELPNPPMYMSRKMASPRAIATQVARTTSRRQSRSASSRSSALLGVLGGKSGFSNEALRRRAGAWSMRLWSASFLNCSEEGLRRRAGGLSTCAIVPFHRRPFSLLAAWFSAAGPRHSFFCFTRAAGAASQSSGSESSEANLVCALRAARAATGIGAAVQVCSRVTRRQRWGQI
mmetsp:Transcript_1142/g.3061  ORF Transcript_1142/g.3061 Transcript_1142/m.3061 type:complete len:242 (+) Transcript_1142:620-1345(+)